MKALWAGSLGLAVTLWAGASRAGEVETRPAGTPVVRARTRHFEPDGPGMAWTAEDTSA